MARRHHRVMMAAFILMNLLTLIANPVRAAAIKPNIIVILTDDVGYSDLGCYGGEIKTPHLDQLAADGLRFTQFYNTGRCCPTRASLLTGLYPHQAGIGHMMRDYGHPGYKGDLGRDAVTIPEVMKSAGYKSYLSGKWHVTPVAAGESMVKASKHNWPLQRGFDRFYGTIHGAGSLWDPNSLTRDNDFISPFADWAYKPKEKFYYTHAISDHAVKFIQEHNADKPFFMYVAYTAAHWPMHAPEADIDKYNGYYDEGYRPIREARYKRMLELGVITPSARMSPQVWDWSKWTDPKERAWEIRNMQTYAAMMTIMDEGVGQITRSLKDKGMLDNTLILYMQDNGGCQENMGRGRKVRKGYGSGERPASPNMTPMKDTDFQTQMIPFKSRDGYKTRMGPGAMPGPDDTYIAYGEGWANVSNTPFRLYKHYNHEGGISTPLIAHWPKGIKAKGELRHTPSHLIDIMATCIELGGATYPKRFADTDIQPLEGKSLKSVFDNDTMEERHLLFEHEGNGALRMGDWKLVGKRTTMPGGTNHKQWELYNIKEDRSELNDLSESHPEKRAQMIAFYEKEAHRTRILPSNWGKPKKGKKKK